MAKAKKITKKELEEVREALGQVNGIISQIGQIELSKARLSQQFEEADATLKQHQAALKEKYGEVSIDLEKGEIKEVSAE